MFHAYTASKVKHHPNIILRRFGNILLPESFIGLSNLSECHLTLLLKFFGVYTFPHFWVYP